MSGSDGFTKSVSSRSWISRATGESVDAYRRHWSPAACDRAVFCVRSRLKNEAVTSCNAIPMLMLCRVQLLLLLQPAVALLHSTALHFERRRR